MTATREVCEGVQVSIQDAIDKETEEVRPEIREDVRRLVAINGESEVVEQRWPQGNVYLSRIAVQGFRGVGSQVELNLPAHPGVTVVTARNGTGKSSIVEAAELTVAGRLRRIQGARNELVAGLRHADTAHKCAVDVDLQVGTESLSIVHRPKGPVPTAASAAIKIGDDREEHRELGALLAQLHPVLSASDFQEAAGESEASVSRHLAEVIGDRLAALTNRHSQLADELRSIQVQEPRRIVASASSSSAIADEDSVHDLMQSLRDDPEPNLISSWLEARSQPSIAQAPRHRTWAPIDRAELKDSVEAVQRAASRYSQVREESLLAADHLASLLDDLLAATDEVVGPECPVCGGSLDATWRERARATRASITEARDSMAEAKSSFSTGQATIRELTPIHADRSLLSAGQQDRLDALAEQCKELIGSERIEQYVSSSVDVDAFVDSADSLMRELEAENTSAATRMADVEAAVRQLGIDLDRAAKQLRRKTLLEAAQGVLETVYRQVVADLLAAPGSQVASTFNELCSSTGTELRSVGHNGQIPGKGKKPKVDLGLEVRGADGNRGMLSLGQISALALSFFLARMASDEHSVRFVILDDPILAMDEVRIDALARVLRRYADESQLQLVIFTHDMRLERATAAIDPNARIIRLRYSDGRLGVTKDETACDRLLRHAKQAAELDDQEFAALVVAPLVRQAIEAAAYPRFLQHAGWDPERWQKSQTLRRRIEGARFELDAAADSFITECDRASHHGLDSGRTPAEFAAEGAALVRKLLDQG